MKITIHLVPASIRENREKVDRKVSEKNSVYSPLEDLRLEKKHTQVWMALFTK